MSKPLSKESLHALLGIDDDGNPIKGNEADGKRELSRPNTDMVQFEDRESAGPVPRDHDALAPTAKRAIKPVPKDEKMTKQMRRLHSAQTAPTMCSVLEVPERDLSMSSKEHGDLLSDFESYLDPHFTWDVARMAVSVGAVDRIRIVQMYVRSEDLRGSERNPHTNRADRFTLHCRFASNGKYKAVMNVTKPGVIVNYRRMNEGAFALAEKIAGNRLPQGDFALN